MHWFGQNLTLQIQILKISACKLSPLLCYLLMHYFGDWRIYWLCLSLLKQLQIQPRHWFFVLVWLYASNTYRGYSYFHAILFRMLCLSASISYGYSCARGIKLIKFGIWRFFTCKWKNCRNTFYYWLSLMEKDGAKFFS